MGLVYCVTCIANGRQYVGKTTTNLSRRKAAHLSDARTGRKPDAFHVALRKHGPLSFRWAVLYEGIPSDRLDIYESFAIRANSTDIHGYNAESGDRILNLVPRSVLRGTRVEDLIQALFDTKGKDAYC